MKLTVDLVNEPPVGVCIAGKWFVQADSAEASVLDRAWQEAPLP